MSEVHTGQCFCGGVRYRVTGALFGVVSCHCKDCQRMHGTFNPMAVVDRGALELVAADTLVWYRSSEGVARGFCGTCGGRLFKDNLGGPKLLVSMGTLDGPTGLRTVKEIWTQSKGDWYDLVT